MRRSAKSGTVLELNNNERSLILQALEEACGSAGRRYSALASTPRILQLKVKSFGITHPDGRKNNSHHATSAPDRCNSYL